MRPISFRRGSSEVLYEHKDELVVRFNIGDEGVIYHKVHFTLISVCLCSLPILLC